MPKYDVAVVGAGLGGLAAAALMAKKRKKVILLEPSEQVGGELSEIRKSGFRFSTGPNLLLGFDRGGVLQELCADLGITHSTSVISPCYQVVLPDRRINVYPEHAETLEELRREFPREIDKLVKFFRDIRKVSGQITRSRLYASLAVWRKAGGFLQQYRFSKELMTFIQIPALFFLRQPAEAVSLASLAMLFDTEPQFIHGGLKGLADQMLDIVLRNGGEVRYAEPWPEPLFSRKRGVDLKTREQVIEAAAVLFNTRLDERGSTLLLGLKDEVIPAGMHQEVLCLADYSHPGDFFFLSLSAKDDETRSLRGMRALTATFPSLLSQPGEGDRLEERVGWLMPFLKPNVVFAEQHRPAPRGYVFPKQVSFNGLRKTGGVPMLSKAASQELYLIPDGSGSSLETVRAARRLAERLV